MDAPRNPVESQDVVVGPTRIPCDLRDGQFPSLPFAFDRGSTVPLLRQHVRPPAVGRLVIAVVINAVQCHPLRPLPSHVFRKRIKIIAPLLAHLNSPPSVIHKRRMVAVVTPRHHRPVNAVKRVLLRSDGIARLAQNLPPQAPAGLGCAVKKRASSHLTHRSALATAIP